MGGETRYTGLTRITGRTRHYRYIANYSSVPAESERVRGYKGALALGLPATVSARGERREEKTTAASKQRGLETRHSASLLATFQNVRKTAVPAGLEKVFPRQKYTAAAPALFRGGRADSLAPGTLVYLHRKLAALWAPAAVTVYQRTTMLARCCFVGLMRFFV